MYLYMNKKKCDEKPRWLLDVLLSAHPLINGAKHTLLHSLYLCCYIVSAETKLSKTQCMLFHEGFSRNQQFSADLEHIWVFKLVQFDNVLYDGIELLGNLPKAVILLY